MGLTTVQRYCAACDGECTTEFRTKLNRGQSIVASLQKIRKSHSITDLNEDTTNESVHIIETYDTESDLTTVTQTDRCGDVLVSFVIEK